MADITHELRPRSKTPQHSDFGLGSTALMYESRVIRLEK
jgi:hypothetical protein